MNIGLFSDAYLPQINGVVTSTHILAEGLRKLGHTVYIFTPTDPNIKPEDDSPYIIRMASMPCFFLKQFRIGIVYSPHEIKKMIKLNLDIVHTQTEFSLGFFGKFYSKAFNVPMVHTYHTMYEDYVHYIVNGSLITPSMAKEFSKIFCNSANAVIAPTEKIQNLLIEYGVKKPIAVLPTGININNFRKSNFSKQEIDAIKQENGIPLDAPVILSLGRVAKEKSIDTIISNLPKVFEAIPKSIFVIVGDGPYIQNLKEQSENLGISERIIFLGAKPWQEIGKYYQLGDVFVSASLSETQGLTFVEAMAGGIPVVAKEDECIEIIIKNNVSGIIFKNDDELSDILIDILNNSKKRKTLAQTAIKFAENLSAENFANNMASIYEDILNNPENYNVHKRKISPIIMSKKIAGRIKKLNNEINLEISQTGKAIKTIVLKPVNLIKKNGK